MSAGISHSGSVVSVNVSAVRTRVYGGETVATGIFKTPVPGRSVVRGVNIAGDDQADRENHGGPERAVYAYAHEDYAWWSEETGRALSPGVFGENLTLRDIDVSGALIGERWRIGSAEFAVTSPRVPCYKLAMAMDDPGFVKRFAQAARPGAYLRIVDEGDVAAGDPVVVTFRPAHQLTVATMAHIYLFERHRAAELQVPEIPSTWRGWVDEQLTR